MSSDDNHRWAHMTHTACNICTCAVFATSSFNFGLLTYSVSHFCYGRALYAVFCRNVCLKKSRAELLTVVWQMTCQRSHICWCVSCWHDVFYFASSVSFGSFENLILSSQRLVSLSFKKTTVHINLLEQFFFLRDRCLRLSLSLLTLFVMWHLAPHDSNIDSHACRI